ncbi:unnamed protein product [Amoebophrya sp. A25]|nr:unnamed protein product [Amoebophrya sp. A25]|eukprot:GSA25T00021138001.1
MHARLAKFSKEQLELLIVEMCLQMAEQAEAGQAEEVFKRLPMWSGDGAMVEGESRGQISGQVRPSSSERRRSSKSKNELRQRRLSQLGQFDAPGGGGAPDLQNKMKSNAVDAGVVAGRNRRTMSDEALSEQVPDQGKNPYKVASSFQVQELGSPPPRPPSRSNNSSINGGNRRAPEGERPFADEETYENAIEFNEFLEDIGDERGAVDLLQEKLEMQAVQVKQLFRHIQRLQTQIEDVERENEALREERAQLLELVSSLRLEEDAEVSVARDELETFAEDMRKLRRSLSQALSHPQE